MPTVPLGVSVRSFSTRAESFPAALRILMSPPLRTATPAESYPRYSMRRRPSIRIGEACFGPTYPTIPHIAWTTSRLKEFPANLDQLLRLGLGGRFRNEADHRFGARRPEVNPSGPPGEPKSVPLIHGSLGEPLLERRVRGLQVTAPWCFGLHDLIARSRAHQGGHRLVLDCQILQD